MLRNDPIEDHQFFLGETCKGALIASEGGLGVVFGVQLLERLIQGFGHNSTEFNAPRLCGTLGCRKGGGRKRDCRANLLWSTHNDIVASNSASICISNRGKAP